MLKLVVAIVLAELIERGVEELISLARAQLKKVRRGNHEKESVRS
jgi:predicted DNA-binding protein